MKKVVWIILTGILVLAVCGFLIFKIFVAQGVTPSYEINKPVDGQQNILIATQKKGFKDKVMKNISEYYTDKPVYIKVIDVTKLDGEQKSDWDKIVIFTTVEMGKVPGKVTDFLERQSDLTGIFMPVTAASGMWNGNKFDVDTVATASKNENTDKISGSVIEFIDGID